MRFKRFLPALGQPRMWLTVAFVVSQVIQAGTCCCSRGHTSRPVADCCCELTGDEVDSGGSALLVHDEACETSLPHECRCDKNVRVGTKPELATVPNQRTNFFDVLAQPAAPITFNFGNARALEMRSGRKDVVALRGAVCCTVLCRWLC